MINKMCWNSSGWQYPTGSADEGGYPGENGFGHEEWNFNLEDNVDGFIYAYVYYKPPPSTVVKADGEFRIGFWALEPRSKTRQLVGIYNTATVPSLKDYSRADEVFGEEGVYSRRVDELMRAVPTLGRERAHYEVTQSIRKQWLSFRCPIDSVRVLDNPIPVDDLVSSKGKSYWFAIPTFIKDDELPDI